jgi:drug/metabolite transporter, DME family
LAAARQPAIRRPLIGAALFLGAASFWATFGIFARRLYDAGFEPLELASVRAAVGFLAVALILLVRAPWRRSLRLTRGAALFLAAYGVIGYALFTLVYLASLERTGVAVAAALLYTAPAFVLLMSALVWRERVTLLRGMAVLLVLGGVLLVTGAAGAFLRGTAALPATALLVGIGAGLTYAVYTMFSKVAVDRYGAPAALFWCFAAAAVALALIAPPHRPFLHSPGEWPLLIALGIVPTLIPYGLYLAALRELRASTAAMLASVEPVIAAGLAAVLLHERLELMQGLGVLLVVSAAALLTRQVAREAE